MKNNRPEKKWGLKIFIILLVLLICFLTYHQLWYKAERVDGNIFKLERTLAAHRAEIWTVRFSPNGTLLASGSVDSSVKIWNKETGNLVIDLKHPSGITNIAFSPDGNFIATTAYDEKVRLWKLPEGVLVKEFTGHKGTVWSVDFSADGKTIASSGEDASIKLWDTSGRLIRTLTGHSLNIWNVKFSPDGKWIASGSYDKTVKIWNVSMGKNEHTLTDHSEAIVAIAYSQNGKILASTSDDKTIKLWNTNNWSLVRTLTVPEHVQAVDFSPNCKMLAAGGRDKPVVGEFLQNFLGDSKYNKGVSMRLWDVGTGKLLQTFSEHANDVNDISWCPDGKWIATGSSDRTVELWRLSNY